jgi:hypothetical protein
MQITFAIGLILLAIRYSIGGEKQLKITNDADLDYYYLRITYIQIRRDAKTCVNTGIYRSFSFSAKGVGWDNCREGSNPSFSAKTLENMAYSRVFLCVSGVEKV